MDPQTLIIWLIVGAIAGWLAGQIMTGFGFGLVGNIVLGIVGAIVAGWLFPNSGRWVGFPGPSYTRLLAPLSFCSSSAS